MLCAIRFHVKIHIWAGRIRAKCMPNMQENAEITRYIFAAFMILGEALVSNIIVKIVFL